MTKLIIETGATKSDWCLICPDGQLRKIQTGGINMTTMPRESIEKVIMEAFMRLDVSASRIDEVHAYAAGMLGNELSEYFPYSYVECASDLLAAARAIFGHDSGVAACLGTGSNSGLYDGNVIVKNFKSGGFILGDEGSGATLGRIFIADYLKGLLPEELAAEFGKEFKVDYATVVANVYKGETPSAYLGSFAPWILQHIDSSTYVSDLVEENIRSFFDRALVRYGDYPIGIVGGFAHALQQVIMKVASERGANVIGILPNAADRLIDFHR